MQASNREIKGLGGTVGRGQRNWEKAVAGDLATCRRMVAATDGKSRAWRSVRYWLSPRFLPTCKSGDDEPNGEVASRNGPVAEKVHWRVFPSLKRSDGGEGVLELPRTKVVVARIRHNH